MTGRLRHVLSMDDGPFDKYGDRDVLVVGVVTAGKDLLEGVLTTRVAVDGENITERLSSWISGSRFQPSLRALFLNGITMAGLSVVDLGRLSRGTNLPVICVHRRAPENEAITRALRTAGFPERVALLKSAGPASTSGRIHFTCAGIDAPGAREFLARESGRSHLPEGLRLAHIIAQGMVLGESKGRP